MNISSFSQNYQIKNHQPNFKARMNKEDAKVLAEFFSNDIALIEPAFKEIKNLGNDKVLVGFRRAPVKNNIEKEYDLSMRTPFSAESFERIKVSDKDKFSKGVNHLKRRHISWNIKNAEPFHKRDSVANSFKEVFPETTEFIEKSKSIAESEDKVKVSVDNLINDYFGEAEAVKPSNKKTSLLSRLFNRK